MSKRRLRRQLSLAQVVMLGAAGTISTEIFVLTGHAAGIAGPATVIAMLLAGLLTFPIALNYCELATSYPETGGAMTYVREAFGQNLLAFLVGSLDCLSSTFYSALSAVGFAYSLQILIPALPIIPTALAIIAVFVVLNILGVNQVGNVQLVLGGILVACLGVYVIGGFTLPGGFSWQTLTAGGWFIETGSWVRFTHLLATVALIYNAYVGFEVIADDAEEVTNPARTLPAAILISLVIVTLFYCTITVVTLGTVPWQQVAGSETALTDAVRYFLPRFGVPLLAFAGLIATLTSVNTAMLSATREAFTLSRDGAWPRVLSRLSRFRTPYVATIAIGIVTAIIAAIGLVDFISYISSSGYLFVLFWASLALVRLRKLHPDLKRPFKVPFYPLTPYLAAAAGVIVIAFTQLRALLFGAGLILTLSLMYYGFRPFGRALAARSQRAEEAKDRLLVPVANPATAKRLVHVATMLASGGEDVSICVLTVLLKSDKLSDEHSARLAARVGRKNTPLLRQIAAEAVSKNVPLYTRLRPAHTVAEGVIEEVRDNVKLILMGWPGPLQPEQLAENPVKVIVQKAPAHVAVLLDRGLQQVHSILVPVGGGPHSRLAVRLAYEIAEDQDARMTVLHCVCEQCEPEEIQDRLAMLREIVEDELGAMPERISLRLSFPGTVSEGIMHETTQAHYDLIVAGASIEWMTKTRLFGEVDDQVAAEAPCSVLFVRRHEPAVITWIRRRTKRQG